MVGRITVRDGRMGDGERVAGIWLQMMRHHASISSNDYGILKDAPARWLKFYRKNVRSKDMKALVAEREGRIIGFLLGSIHKRPPCYRTRRQGFISDLAVASGERRRGAGTILLNAFSAWARKRGVRYMTLSVDAQNRAARRFYRKMGFRTALLTERKML